MNADIYEERAAIRRMRGIVRGLLAEMPFFGVLALRMDLESDPKIKDITANGEIIRYNPSWVMTERVDIVREAMGHVILACGLEHQYRRGERNNRVWQRASREVTLPILRAAGLSWSDGGLDDMTVEDAYTQLMGQRLLPNKQPGEVEDAHPPVRTQATATATRRTRTPNPTTKTKTGRTRTSPRRTTRGKSPKRRNRATRIKTPAATKTKTKAERET